MAFLEILAQEESKKVSVKTNRILFANNVQNKTKAALIVSRLTNHIEVSFPIYPS